MVRVVVCGATGRMGSRLVQMLRETEGFALAGAIVRPDDPRVGHDAGEATGGGITGVLLADRLEPALPKADVVLDFTSAAGALDHLKLCAGAGRPIIIGATGFTLADLGEMRALAAKVPCVLSPNMSVGVNILYRIAEEAARRLGPEYDVEIVEAHHRHKRDAPSGTAMRLAETIAGVLGRELEEVLVTGRQGLVGERPAGAIGVQAVRGGDIVGEHTVIFAGPGERLELVHRAHSRDNFARGALRAARWVVGQPPGLYDMQDVLGLRAGA